MGNSYLNFERRSIQIGWRKPELALGKEAESPQEGPLGYGYLRKLYLRQQRAHPGGAPALGFTEK